MNRYGLYAATAALVLLVTTPELQAQTGVPAHVRLQAMRESSRATRDATRQNMRATFDQTRDSSRATRGTQRDYMRNSLTSLREQNLANQRMRSEQMRADLTAYRNAEFMRRLGRREEVGMMRDQRKAYMNQQMGRQY